MIVTTEDRTDHWVGHIVSSEGSTLRAWIGARLGEVDGVLAVYYACERPPSALPPAPREVHRVWTIPASPGDASLREAIRDRQAMIARKFPEITFEFLSADRADKPVPAATLIYKAQ